MISAFRPMCPVKNSMLSFPMITMVHAVPLTPIRAGRAESVALQHEHFIAELSVAFVVGA